MSTHYFIARCKTSLHLLFCVSVFVLFFSYTQEALAATLSVSPGTGVYSTGQTFTARVTVNTSGAAINAADGTIKFNPSELSVVSVSKGSIFNLWTAEPSFSNSAGTISFSGGSPTGYTGAAGTVLSVTFKAKTAGSPKVQFSSGSVLAADGRGTNVLTKMNGGAYTISAVSETPEAEVIVEYVPPANTPGAPKVVSKTHTDPTLWYKEKTASLSWDVPSGVVAIRTLLDTNPTSIPTKVYDSPVSSLTLADLDEGVNYFHIQFRNADGWGKVAHYKLAIDSLPPSAFNISLKEGNDPSNPKQKLALTLTEPTSKVRLFKVQIDGKDPVEMKDETGSSTLELPPVEPGYHTLSIEAFDEAGNSIVATFSFTVIAFEKPQFIEYPHEINEQVIPVIKGKTKPHAKVQVSLTKLGVGVSQAYAVVTKEVTSDDQGAFIFMPDGRLTLGVYELTAFATDAAGARSEVSDPVSIAVQQPGYLRFGSLIVSFLSVIIPLLALTLLLVLGSIYLIARMRLFRRGVRKEALEAHKMLVSEFGQLKDILEVQKGELEASRKTKKLTQAEESLFDALTKSLSASERKVMKEIEDVEGLVE